MRIAIVTQDAPLYMASFLDDFVKQIKSGQHQIGFLVAYSPLFNHTFIQELRQRMQFYGFSAFVKVSLYIAWNKFLSILSGLLSMDGTYSVAQVCQRHQIKISAPQSPNASAFIKLLHDEHIDLLVSVACPKILKETVLNTPRYGCINYHTGLLPRYRGRQPMFWAMLNGESEIGVTIHVMDTVIDNGPILVQEHIPIEPRDTLHDLYLKTTKRGSTSLIKAIDLLASGDKSRIQNDAALATYFSFPTAQDSAQFRRAGKRFM